MMYRINADIPDYLIVRSLMVNFPSLCGDTVIRETLVWIPIS